MSLSVAVVGAGLAGLVCARQLAAAGATVTLFEKSRGLGGRLATRRADGGFGFDHGAQYVIARSAGFQALLRDLEQTGSLAAWQPRDPAPRAGGTDDTWWVGTPGMTALFRPLAEGLDIRFATRVVSQTEGAEGIELGLEEDRRAGPFDRLVLAIPPHQAADLLPGRPEVELLAAVQIAPCWSVMLAFETALEVDFDVWRGGAGALAWAARNASKPGRDPGADTWVLHAAPDWSTAQLEREASDILPELTAAFAALVDPLPLPPRLYAAAHRWRYARTVMPLGRLFLDGGRILVGGDWCLGARVEAAYDSGLAMAEAILEQAGLEKHP